MMAGASSAERAIIELLLADAARLQHEGRSADAEIAYNRIVAQRADCHQAWAELGLLAFRAGNLVAAVEHTEKAASIDKRVALYWRNLCELRRLRGKFKDAIAAGRRATRLDPTDPEAHYNFSLALGDSGQIDEAIACVCRVLELNPRHGFGWNNLGHWLIQKDLLSEAAQAFEKAVAIDESNSEAHHNLAIVALRFGNTGEALKYFDRAIAINPQFAEYGHEGLRALKAAAVGPPPPAPQDDYYLGPGLKMWEEGRFEEAIAFYMQLLPTHANDIALLGNCASSLFDAGRAREAMEMAHRALEIDPNPASVRLVLGTAQLQLGLWEDGWRNYEVRFAGAHEVQTGQARFANIPLPRWDGGTPHENASILVVVEQGYGDMIQFCRYLYLLQRKFARVGLLTSPPLARLMDWTFGEDIAIFTNYPSDYSSWDCHCMMMSLPHLFKTDVDTVPSRSPYLKLPSASKEAWRLRLNKNAKHSFRIGLSWTGRPQHRFNTQRTVPDEQLARLLGVEGVTFVSLQPLADGQPAPAIPAGVDWLDWTPELADFSVTAALVANLDLVISIDSAMVHLAGALGKPVWLMDRFNSEWRWMAPREDSPWYPSLRIFRQGHSGDWVGVVDRVIAELKNR